MAIDFNSIPRYARTIKLLTEQLANPERFTSKEARKIIDYNYHTVNFDTLKEWSIVTVVDKEEFEVAPKLYEKCCIFDDQGKFITSFAFRYEAEGAVGLLKKVNHADYEIRFQVPPNSNKKVNGVRYYYKLDTDQFIREAEYRCKMVEKKLERKEKHLKDERKHLRETMKKARL